VEFIPSKAQGRANALVVFKLPALMQHIAACSLVPRPQLQRATHAKSY